MTQFDNNKNIPCLALDAMGGDNAPHAVIAGANLFLKSNVKVKFIFFGDKAKILPILNKYPNLKSVATIEHTTDVISSEEQPSVALRRGKNSSMRLAIEAVKNGFADAVVSSGNTGALMVMSKLIFKTLDGIDRPAIGTIIPSIKGKIILLDMGANSVCDANNLAQFAVIGDALAKSALGLQEPSIGLLNIGSEELKGHEVIRVAHQLIASEHPHLNYKGYVEGDDIMKGSVDVVVTDGFTGNVTLKAMEGTSKFIKSLFKKGFNSSLISKIGMFLSSFSLKKVFSKIDPRNYNGAMFLGLNNICVKSHGNADEVGFCNAISVTEKLIRNKVNQKIIDELNNQ